MFSVVKKLAISLIAISFVLSCNPTHSQVAAKSDEFVQQIILKQTKTTYDTIAKACVIGNPYQADILLNQKRVKMVISYQITPEDERDGLQQLTDEYNTNKMAIYNLNSLPIKKKLKKGETISIPANTECIYKTEKIEVAKKKIKFTTKKGQVKFDVSKLTQGQAMRMTATAYGYNGNGPWGTRTASGTKVRLGVIAVDPRVIPLGTKVLITGYKSHPLLPPPQEGLLAIAEDTGGAIKGNIIDIFLPTSEAGCSSFGRQSVRLIILK